MVVFEWFINKIKSWFKPYKADETYVLPDHTSRSHEIAPWMAIARNELGQVEIAGPENNERIVEYGKYVDMEVVSDSLSWCATFVNYVLEKSGYKGTRSPVARSFSNWGRKIEGPVYGCIVVLSRGSVSWQGHVGFFVGFKGQDLLILGGNQDDSVSIKKYKRNKVLAYRMPE